MRVPTAADGKKTSLNVMARGASKSIHGEVKKRARFTSEYGKLKKRKSLPEDTQVTKKQ